LPITEHLTQSAYTPAEVTRLKNAYDRIVASVGEHIPLGLKEAIAAEVMTQAAKMQKIDEEAIISRVEAALDL
jgi:hypothetical protein